MVRPITTEETTMPARRAARQCEIQAQLPPLKYGQIFLQTLPVFLLVLGLVGFTIHRDNEGLQQTTGRQPAPALRP